MPVVGIYLRGNLLHIYMSRHVQKMFMEPHLLIGQKERKRLGETQPKWPAIEECINKVRYSHTTGYIAE